MKIINASYKILSDFCSPINFYKPNESIVKNLEYIARICTQTNSKCETSKKDLENIDSGLMQKLINNNHHSVLEHSILSVLFVVDRAIANELTRHRLASFTQESTRYCNYDKDRFDSELTFIKPYYLKEETVGYTKWFNLMKEIEETYFELLRHTDCKLKPEEARCILPLSLKTELVMTANYREWRHIFQMRNSKNAHPQMREIMNPLLAEIKRYIPIVFDDLYVWENVSHLEYVNVPY